MKRSGAVSTILSLMLAATYWVTISNEKSTAAPAVAASTDNCISVGRLISIQGKVQLKRQGWSSYHPTVVGAILCLGDLLFPSKGARVTVHCAGPDQNFWNVPSGVLSGAAIGCRSPNKLIHTVTGPIVPTRSSFARRIPHIISPNSTWLLNNKPKLHWQAVPGATSYTVRVSGPRVNWVTEVKTTEVIYPGEPPLKPVEEGYLLTVEADNSESPMKATFGLLDEDKAARVRAAARRIASQSLPDEAKTLALADLYMGQGLIAEAIDLLEAVIAKGSKTATIHYTLGELYAQLELLYKAEGNYLKAVELARTSKDIEGQAAAAAKLGEVYTALGESDKAIRWKKIAQTNYRAL